jgi:hypothetical protein
MDTQYIGNDPARKLWRDVREAGVIVDDALISGTEVRVESALFRFSRDDEYTAAPGPTADLVGRKISIASVFVQR